MHVRIFTDGEEEIFFRSLRLALEGVELPNDESLAVIGRYPAHLVGLFQDYEFLEVYLDCFFEIDFPYKLKTSALKINVLKNQQPVLLGETGWISYNNVVYGAAGAVLYNVLARYCHFTDLRLIYETIKHFEVLQFEFGRVRFYLNLFSFLHNQSV